MSDLPVGILDHLDKARDGGIRVGLLAAAAVVLNHRQDLLMKITQNDGALARVAAAISGTQKITEIIAVIERELAKDAP